MKFIKIFAVLTCILILQSCETPTNNTFWVSGIKTQCAAGAGKMYCLNIYKGDDINNPKWENFYAKIEGFEFEEGFLKKIEVKEEKLKNVPADASSIKYTMVNELEKQVDLRTLVSGNWILNQLQGNPIDRSIKLPELDVKLNHMQISGSGGCNIYSSKIEELTANNIRFGNVVNTRKACNIKLIEQEYFDALKEVRTYQLKEGSLVFYNKEGGETLSFMKKIVVADKQRLQNNWIATRIAGSQINKMAPLPRMEINVTDMKVLGNNSCNNFSGEIKDISDAQIVFGSIASTKKMCRNMDIADRFNANLAKVDSYKFEGLNLLFLNKNGDEVLAFIKAD